MHLIDEIRAKRDEIYAIARKHRAEKLWVFGSVARREERPDSDIDFLVSIPSDMTYFQRCDFSDEIAGALGRSVDLIPLRALETSPCFAYNAKKDMVAL